EVGAAHYLGECGVECGHGSPPVWATGATGVASRPRASRSASSTALRSSRGSITSSYVADEARRHGPDASLATSASRVSASAPEVAPPTAAGIPPSVAPGKANETV